MLMPILQRDTLSEVKDEKDIELLDKTKYSSLPTIKGLIYTNE